MKSEPAVSIGTTISAVMLAVFAILKASGMGVTDEMTTGINALVTALCAVPAVSGALTRFFVYSPTTLARLTGNPGGNGGEVAAQGIPEVKPA